MSPEKHHRLKHGRYTVKSQAERRVKIEKERRESIIRNKKIVYLYNELIKYRENGLFEGDIYLAIVHKLIIEYPRITRGVIAGVLNRLKD